MGHALGNDHSLDHFVVTHSFFSNRNEMNADFLDKSFDDLQSYSPSKQAIASFGTFSILISGVNSIVSTAPITILTPALYSLNCRGVDKLEKRRQRLTSGTFYLVRKSF